MPVPAKRTQKILLSVVVVFAVVGSVLLFRLRTYKKSDSGTNEAITKEVITEGEAVIAFENEDIKEYKILGILKESPSIDENNFVLFKLGVNRSGQEEEVVVRAYLLPGPSESGSIIITQENSANIENQQDDPLRLYSVDDALLLLQNRTGEEIAISIVMSKNQSDMEDMLDEITSAGCTEQCELSLSSIRENLPDSVKTLEYLEGEGQYLSGMTIVTIATQVNVKE